MLDDNIKIKIDILKYKRLEANTKIYIYFVYAKVLPLHIIITRSTRIIFYRPELDMLNKLYSG